MSKITIGHGRIGNCGGGKFWRASGLTALDRPILLSLPSILSKPYFSGSESKNIYTSRRAKSLEMFGKREMFGGKREMFGESVKCSGEIVNVRKADREVIGVQPPAESGFKPRTAMADVAQEKEKMLMSYVTNGTLSSFCFTQPLNLALTSPSQ
ncbi:hypothetical protein BDZ89DRAFT_1042794 [Hymenopellis radicata]|nr:hypothetical protein BDZ89DRAFT_1042794 [Hymenopellis radicata]